MSTRHGDFPDHIRLRPEVGGHITRRDARSAHPTELRPPCLTRHRGLQDDEKEESSSNCHQIHDYDGPVAAFFTRFKPNDDFERGDSLNLSLLFVLIRV